MERNNKSPVFIAVIDDEADLYIMKVVRSSLFELPDIEKLRVRKEDKHDFEIMFTEEESNRLMEYHKDKVIIMN